MAENGEGPRRRRPGEAARPGARRLAGQWRTASPRRDWMVMERRPAAEVGEARGGRSDEGADFVRQAIQDLFR
jgi:hypothetical protein